MESFEAATCRSRDASASARVRPVGRPTLPPGRCQGATHTFRVLSKYGSAAPFVALLTTVTAPVNPLTMRLARVRRACRSPCVALRVATFESNLESNLESNRESNTPGTSRDVDGRRWTYVLFRATLANIGGRPETLWRRWTGLEPLSRGHGTYCLCDQDVTNRGLGGAFRPPQIGLAEMSCDVSTADAADLVT